MIGNTFILFRIIQITSDFWVTKCKYFIKENLLTFFVFSEITSKVYFN